MSEQGQLFDPDDPGGDAEGKWQRHGQSHTSHAAAIEAVPLTGKARIAVFTVIKVAGSYGATDEEIQITLGMNPSTQRPRRVELVEQGRIEDSGRERRTKSGRGAVVWVVSEGVGVPAKLQPPLESRVAVAHRDPQA